MSGLPRGSPIERPGAQSSGPDDGIAAQVPGDEVLLPVHFEGPFKALKDAMVRAFEHEYLTRLLLRARGNVARAAREAGLDRKHLYSLLHKHGLLHGRGD